MSLFDEEEPVGTEYDHQELLYVPAQVKVVKHYSRTYGCPKCKEEAEVLVFVKSKVTPPLLKHSFASPSAVAWTMYQKYVNAVPLCRQEKDWMQYGAEISRTTLVGYKAVKTGTVGSGCDGCVPKRWSKKLTVNPPDYWALTY